MTQAIATPACSSGAEIADITARPRRQAPGESEGPLHDFGAILEEGAKCPEEGPRNDAPWAENDPPTEASARKQPDRELRSCEEASQEPNEDENKVAEEEVNGVQDDETTAAEEVEPTPSEGEQAQDAEPDAGVEQGETAAVDDATPTPAGDGVVTKIEVSAAAVRSAAANLTDASSVTADETIPADDSQRGEAAPESPAPATGPVGEPSRPDGEAASVETKTNKGSADPPGDAGEASSRQVRAAEDASRPDPSQGEVKSRAERATQGEQPAPAATRPDLPREGGDAEREQTPGVPPAPVSRGRSEPPPMEVTPNSDDLTRRFAYGRTETPFGERVASLVRQGRNGGGGESIALPAEAPLLRPTAAGLGGGTLNATRFVEDMIRQAQLINRPDGSAEIRLRLEPPELGSVLVRLSLRGDRLHADLEVDSAAAREMVGGTLQRLREALSSEGIDLEKFNIGLRQQPSRQPDREAHQQSSQRGGGFDSDTAADPQGELPGVRALRTASLSAAGMIDFIA